MMSGFQLNHILEESDFNSPEPPMDHYRNIVASNLSKIARDSNVLDGRTFLLKHLKKLHRHLKPKYLYFELIFSVIELFRVTDVDVVKAATEHYIARQLDFYYLGCEKCPLTYRFRRSEPVRLTEFSVLSYFGFSGKNCDFEVAKRLLRYGARVHFEEENVRNWLLDNLDVSFDEPGLYLDLEVAWEEIDHLIFRECAAPSAARRLHLILLTIRAVCLKKNDEREGHFSKLNPEETLHQGFLSSVKLLFKCIKDPFITIEEVRRFYESIFYISYEYDEKIDQLCSEFAEEYSRSVEPYQPRSLRHLCRCQVRESLVASSKLPHGVWELPAPNAVKNYILIQEDENDFYPSVLIEVLGKKSDKE